MVDHARIDALLLRYEELRDQKTAVSAEELCRDCPELLEELKRQLRMLDAMNALLDNTPSAAPTAATRFLEAAPGGACPPRAETLAADARFQVLRFHARGGLGEVHVARDEELRREVALKRLQPVHARNPKSRRRFLREAEITCRLEHPSVVPVHALGHDADGSPFYAMRFVQGETLHEAIRRFHAAEPSGRDPSERRLALRQLLARMVAVCNTVAYAHSRGIVHRDIKPSNILLGPYGETLVVDWGLAREVAAQESGIQAPSAEPGPGEAASPESAPHDPTPQGAVVGTPAYMSPEQAEGRWDLLGPASDVYSLGATLYVLLTGQAPFQAGQVGEVLEKVKEGHLIPPRQRNKDIPRALEAICLKAMARRPEARYHTALHLAADLEHWLADEPVSAYRERLPARLARWGRRHKTSVASSAVLLLTAVVALSIGLVLVGQANSRTKEQRDLAQRNADKAEAINRFLVNDLIREAAPEQNPADKQITVAAALEEASRKIGSAFEEQPEIEASLRLTIGNALRSLGRNAEAEPHLTKALDLHRRLSGPEHPDTLNAQRDLAGVLLQLKKLPLAAELLQDNLKASRKVFGPEHPLTLKTLNSLAVYHWRRGELAKAEELYRQVLNDRRRILGREDADTLDSMSNLGVLLLVRSQRERALPILRDAWEGLRQLSGRENPRTLTVRFMLAEALRAGANRDDAEPLYREVWEARCRVLGPDHQDTLLVLDRLVRLLRQRGQAATAQTFLRETIQYLRTPPQDRQTKIADLERLLAD
jgi:serine/threonine protein kinase